MLIPTLEIKHSGNLACKYEHLYLYLIEIYVDMNICSEIMVYKRKGMGNHTHLIIRRISFKLVHYFHNVKMLFLLKMLSYIQVQIYIIKVFC